MLPQTLQIHCYDVVSFVTEIEKAFKLGYCLDLYNVQNYPVQLGYQFITTMIKKEQAVEQELEVPAEAIKSPLEAPETDEVGDSTAEGLEAVVEAPKKSPGRPAKGK